MYKFKLYFKLINMHLPASGQKFIENFLLKKLLYSNKIAVYSSAEYISYILQQNVSTGCTVISPFFVTLSVATTTIKHTFTVCTCLSLIRWKV